MKNKTIHIILLSMAVLMSCTTNETRRISILDDRTEGGQTPLGPEFKSKIGTEPSIWNGQIVRYQVISDIHINVVKELVLLPASQLGSNETNRKKEVNEFANQIQELRDTNTTEFDHSSIWIPLTKELSYLSTDSTIPATIYLISDLMENVPWLSLYTPTTQYQLKTAPHKIREIYQSKMPIMGKTNHINLVIVHKPTYENGELFMGIVDSIYRPILEDSLGILISIKAHI